MDGLEATTKIIEAIVWPVVAASMAYSFKDQIRGLLTYVRYDAKNKMVHLGDASTQANFLNEISEKIEHRKDELKEVIAEKNVSPDSLEKALADYDTVVLEMQAIRKAREKLIHDVLGQWSPGRQDIVERMLDKLGPRRLLTLNDDQLRSEFNEFMLFINGGDVSLPFLRGDLDVLRSAGFIDENNQISAAALPILRMMAREQALKNS